MKVAAVQVISSGDVEANRTLVLEKIREAASNGAQLIVFPEAMSQSFDSGRLDTHAEGLDGDFATAVRDLAEELGVFVVAGMFAPADSVQRGEKTIHRVANTALIAGPGYLGGYEKMHTYDAFNYRESDTVRAGDSLVTFEAFGVTVGLAICYDIRFPEQFKELARRGAQLIVVPTSWADGPGKVEQWRLLTTARALDSTSYVLAAGQARPGGEEMAGQDSGPTGVGHSVLAAPDGTRVAEAGYDEEILYGEVDLDTVAATRKALPVLDA
ncbi:carbon-nitrogen hydrolase family protein [Corynebacterium sp. YSMAA1_1_D6]|uniref:carbon-nitrogen hydrolase family protein n=1 Tax=Corynebacterium sp. YSMAA1_1_D6 TaxID=3383589 RepID=UPI0038D15B0C